MIVRFKDKIKDDNNKVGNKAKFLMMMLENKFNVPNGIVLDSDSYLEIIKDNKIDTKIEKLLNSLTKDNVSHVSEEIIKLFDNVKINEVIISEIEKNINEKKSYAVRSSGTKEDLDSFSFAGQYDTFLNVKGIDNIIDNIIKCYKSMFSEIILSYLVNNNITLDNLKMSVIIEEMIDAEYSGICFTINPLTGNDKEMIFEVSSGLGDNIVSGKVKPVSYRYNWYDKKFVEKNKLLNKNLLDEMAETFTKIQLFFGYPCDIEFAILKNKLYILQARQITKIKYTSIQDMWSTADFKDGGVSASICTPYMWSLYEYIWEYTLRKFIIDSKILKDKEIPKKLGEMFYARCYWNMSAVKRAMSKVVGYKEREFDSEYGVKINYEGDGETTKITPKSIFDITRMALAQSKILKTRKHNAENYKERLLKKYDTYKAIYDSNIKIDIEATFYELTHNTYLQSEATYFWQIFINTIHQSLYKDGLLKYVSESDYLVLLSNIDNISHLLPFYDMWEVTRHIRKDKKAYAYWTTKNTTFLERKIDNDNYYMSEVKEIINKYGYHSDSELDVTYPCYYEDIKPILQSIKDMVLLTDEYSPLKDKERGTERYEQILNKIKVQVSKTKYKKLERKIINMRKMLWWREEFRDISTKFYYIIRIYTLKLAEYYYDKKIIKDINDIWYLKVGDIWKFISKDINKKDLNKIIEKNKIYYNSYRNYMSENEIGSIFDGMDKIKNDTMIKGIGANSGIVTGKARVITSFDEIDKLQTNDILVTRFTDTGWTPKFAILSGIVTEYGGILCHAAIVSREYGIPAIVCCTDAMMKIKDGDIITIDGTTGMVTIEE